jgi:hypothetical protein
MNFCRDCKHCLKTPPDPAKPGWVLDRINFPGDWVCHRPRYDPVSGKALYADATCTWEREPGSCGFSGKYFEPKEAEGTLNLKN